MIYLTVGLVYLLLGVVIVVIVLYLVTWKLSHREWLLPLHIWTVALSYALLLSVAAWRLETHPTPRWVLINLASAALIGLFSMIQVARLQTNRLRDEKDVPIQ